MKHPTREQIDTVLSNFAKLPAKKYVLDMDEPEVCGTVLCHAGLYFAACGLEYRRGYTDFSHGANLMAEHLGFEDAEALYKWASDNSYIWGNSFGHFMFTDSIAFKSPIRPNGAKVVTDIFDHWREVMGRIPEQVAAPEL